MLELLIRESKTHLAVSHITAKSSKFLKNFREYQDYANVFRRRTDLVCSHQDQSTSLACLPRISVYFGAWGV